ncbi:MAG: hypothetical protein ACOX2F_11515 [bacterium]
MSKEKDFKQKVQGEDSTDREKETIEIDENYLEEELDLQKMG